MNCICLLFVYLCIELFVCCSLSLSLFRKRVDPVPCEWINRFIPVWWRERLINERCFIIYLFHCFFFCFFCLSSYPSISFRSSFLLFSFVFPFFLSFFLSCSLRSVWPDSTTWSEIQPATGGEGGATTLCFRHKLC